MEIFQSILHILFGGVVLMIGGEFLVRGASRIALFLRIPPLIVGLTVVAACTSAPELTVSLLSCWKANGSPELAVGNVVGSNTFNILGVLGISALFAPIAVSTKLVRREIPIMIFFSLLLWIVGFFCVNEAGLHYIPRFWGAFFLGVFVAYTAWIIREVRAHDNQSLAKDIEESTPTPQLSFKAFFCAMVMFFGGLGLLIGGANWFINGAVFVAQYLGVSQLVIGLTVLAIGTSLPEVVVSIVAVMRGKNDLAIGNVVGSCIFNIAVVLGLTTILVPGGVSVSLQAFRLDIPIMIAATIFGSFLCITDKKLSQWEGLLLLIGYGVYFWYLYSQGH